MLVRFRNLRDLLMEFIVLAKIGFWNPNVKRHKARSHQPRLIPVKRVDLTAEERKALRKRKEKEKDSGLSLSPQAETELMPFKSHAELLEELADCLEDLCRETKTQLAAPGQSCSNIPNP